MTSLAYRVEHSPLWFLGRILIPARYRRRACEKSGRHRILRGNQDMNDVILGRFKCRECGTR